jgi:hypothetical protein
MQLPGGTNVIEYLGSNVIAYLYRGKAICKKIQKLSRILGYNNPPATNQLYNCYSTKNCFISASMKAKNNLSDNPGIIRC